MNLCDLTLLSEGFYKAQEVLTSPLTLTDTPQLICQTIKAANNNRMTLQYEVKLNDAVNFKLLIKAVDPETLLETYFPIDSPYSDKIKYKPDVLEEDTDGLSMPISADNGYLRYSREIRITPYSNYNIYAYTDATVGTAATLNTCKIGAAYHA